jgi:hypothetical protein
MSTADADPAEGMSVLAGAVMDTLPLTAKTSCVTGSAGHANQPRRQGAPLHVRACNFLRAAAVLLALAA